MLKRITRASRVINDACRKEREQERERKKRAEESSKHSLRLTVGTNWPAPVSRRRRRHIVNRNDWVGAHEPPMRFV